MSDYTNEQWEHPRRHPGAKMRARQRFAGGPGFGGFDPQEEGADFGPGFRGRPRHGGPGMHDGPPGMHGGMGFGPWPRGYGRRGGRAKRGDVRAAALALLAEGPMNGYQIIQQIGERSGGMWRPSPGSVYPALAQLEDEGLIATEASDGGRRAYALTETGRGYVAEHAEELKAPWSAMSGDAFSAAADIRTLVHQVHLAAFQVVSAGSEAQVEQARKTLAQTRRALYRILAEDDDAADAGEAAAEVAQD
jgi:DNA-binding PadR family transcriptional regulator